MHAILAALFTAIFSFCHASTKQHAINQPEAIANDQPVFTTPVSATVGLQKTEAVYADGGCGSCRVMNVTYSVR